MTTYKSVKYNISGADLTGIPTSAITSGTFADARISSSSVSQHAQSFDDNKIVNDISTLALRQASNENKGAYNTNSMYVDVFQDSTGITGLTNASRNSGEYVGTISTTTTTDDYSFKQIQTGTGATAVATGGWGTAFSNGRANPPGGSGYASVGIDVGLSLVADFEINVYTGNQTNGNRGSMDYLAYSALIVPNNTDYQGANLSNFWGSYSGNHYGHLNETAWKDVLHSTPSSAFGSSWSDNSVTGNTDQTIDHSSSSTPRVVRSYKNNSTGMYGWRIKFTKSSNQLEIRYKDDSGTSHSTHGRSIVNNMPSEGTVFFVVGEASSGGQAILSNYNGAENLSNYSVLNANATGSFTSNNITASASTSKMGAIITYQDNAGTNTLNTDIVLKLSADGGSNYATATMTAMPDFASGIKMAKVNDLSVTAGTSLKYKLEFANQALASKEARIRGVSLQY